MPKNKTTSTPKAKSKPKATNHAAENERFACYGGDTGEYKSAELNEIRFNNALSCLISELENYDMVGAILDDGKPIYCEPQKFLAEKAIEDYKQIERTFYDVCYLGRMLPLSQGLRQIQVLLCMIDFGNMDVPAEAAMLDGHEPEAITIMQETIRKIYERVGERLREAKAEYSIYGKSESMKAQTERSERKPVGQRAGWILEKLRSLPEYEGMTTPALIAWLSREHKIDIDDSTLRKHLKQLEPYGLKNMPKIGYYIS